MGNGPHWCHSDAIIKVAKGLANWVWWRLPVPAPRRHVLSDLLEWDAPVDSEERRKRVLSLVPPAHKREMAAVLPIADSVAAGYRRTRAGRQVLEIRFDGVAGCLRTPEGGSSRQYVVIRKSGADWQTRLLTVRETARLMGAPDTYALPGTYNDGYKAMGDAVAVPVTAWLARHLLHPLALAARQKGNLYAKVG
jgi:DNA (cytosine-5)-methyltransferase 1